MDRDTEESPQIIGTRVRVAEYLDVSTKTIRRYELEKSFPVHFKKVGKRNRPYYLKPEVDAWLERRSHASEAESQDVAAQTGPQDSGREASEGYRGLVLGMLVVGLTLILLLLGSRARQAREPSGCEVIGTHLRVLGSDGAYLWGLNDSPTARNAQILRPARTPCLVADLDGDRENEVYFNFTDPDELNPQGFLAAYSGGGEELWKVDYGRTLEAHGRRFDRRFGAAFLRTVPMGDRVLLLTVAHHHPFFPAQALLLDPTSGEVVSEYWHPGWIYDIAVADVDDDGQSEILLGGINNPGDGPGHPALAVLEAPFPRPAHVSTSPRNYFGPENHLESAYFLFEIPDSYRARDFGLGVSRIIWTPDQRLVMLGGAVEGEFLFLYFDENFQIIEARPNDAVRIEHDRLYREGILDHGFGEIGRLRLQRMLRLQTAPDANSPEVRDLFEALRASDALGQVGSQDGGA